MLDDGRMNLLTDTLYEMGYSDYSDSIAENIRLQNRIDIEDCDYTSHVMDVLEEVYGEGVYSGYLFALRQYHKNHRLYPREILKKRHPAVFFGTQTPQVQVFYRTSTGVTHNLPVGPSLQIVNHSPTGFNWGYHGSGPAQLALAILLKATNKETAMCWYQTFKSEVIAALPTDGFLFWTLTVKDVKEWVAWKEKIQRETI